MPKPASCIPTAQPVELKNSDDPSLLFIPSCTRVDRCGGCCQHSLLSCQPTQTETLSYQVNMLYIKRKPCFYIVISGDCCSVYGIK